MKIIIFFTLLIVFFIIFLLWNYKNLKTNFNDIPVQTNYNIINYIDEVQNIQKEIQQNSNISKVLLYSNTSIDTLNQITPNEVKELGFESCAKAIEYFQKNNLNLFVPTNELKTPLAEMCKSYLTGMNSNTVDNLNNFNLNIVNITDEINNNLDEEASNLNSTNMIQYLESRNQQITKDSNFSLDKSIGFINNFYQNKMKEKLDPELVPYTDIIYGNFGIIPNQFIQLNNWDIQILSNQIRFIYFNTPILSYKYQFSDINTGANFINIKLVSLNILKNEILNEFEINNFVSFLNDIGFKPNKFINITTVDNGVYAVKSSNFDTMFLIKENPYKNRQNYQFDATFV